MVMSLETDILIVGTYDERLRPEIRTAFRHWQCYSVQVPGAVRGRNFRRAFYTQLAAESRHFGRILDELTAYATARGAQVLPFSAYEPPTEDELDAYDPLVTELHRARAHHPIF